MLRINTLWNRANKFIARLGTCLHHTLCTCGAPKRWVGTWGVTTGDTRAHLASYSHRFIYEGMINSPLAVDPWAPPSYISLKILLWVCVFMLGSLCGVMRASQRTNFTVCIEQSEYIFSLVADRGEGTSHSKFCMMGFAFISLLRVLTLRDVPCVHL